MRANPFPTASFYKHEKHGYPGEVDMSGSPILRGDVLLPELDTSLNLNKLLALKGQSVLNSHLKRRENQKRDWCSGNCCNGCPDSASWNVGGDGTRLSGGQIAGIVVGAIVVLFILVCLVYLWRLRLSAAKNAVVVVEEKRRPRRSRSCDSEFGCDRQFVVVENDFVRRPVRVKSRRPRSRSRYGYSPAYKYLDGRVVVGREEVKVLDRPAPVVRCSGPCCRPYR